MHLSDTLQTQSGVDASEGVEVWLKQPLWLNNLYCGAGAHQWVAEQKCFFYDDFLKGHMVTAVDQGGSRAFEEPLWLNNFYYGAHIQREAG